jgi:hypothetical protein
MLRSAASDEESVSRIVPSRTVLWSGAESAPIALRELLAECGYSLHGRDLEDWPARRVAWLGSAALSARDQHDLSQRRVAVVHPDPGAADALAEALRARGAQVIVLSLGESGLDRAEALDPDAVILQPERFWPAGRAVIDALWQHPWLRWTPVLFVPAERLGRAAASAPDVRGVVQGLRTLCASYDLCSRRAGRNEPFELRLSQLGPVRMLRALLESRSSLRVRLEAPERVYELDLGEGLLIGARVSVQRGGRWEELLGVHALKSLLARLDGHVRVTPVDHPALTNVMAPLEAVLLSGHEAPLLAGPKGQVAQLPRREQATLAGMPAPLLQSRVSIEPARSPSAPEGESGDEDDTSPTTAFHGSVRPVSSPLASTGASASSARLRSRFAFVRAHGRALALASGLMAAGAGAGWAWLSARQDARFTAALPASNASPALSPANVAPGWPEESAPLALELVKPAAVEPAYASTEAAPPDADPRETLEVNAARAHEPGARAASAAQLTLRGQRLHRAGRLRAALTAYQAALEARPGMPRALAAIVELQLARRNPAQALETVHELLKRRKTPDDQRLLGDVYMQAGRREEAFAAYRRAAVRGNATARARLLRYDR